MAIITRTKKEDSKKVRNKYNILLTDEQHAKIGIVRDLGFNIQVLMRAELDSALARILSRQTVAE